MNDPNNEFVTLRKIAMSEIRRTLRGRSIRSFSEEDLADIVIAEYFAAAERMLMRNEVIKNKGAFIRRLTRQCVYHARRQTERRRESSISCEIADTAKQWEELEALQEKLVRLPAANRIQRGIIEHLVRGFNVFDPEDQREIAACLGTSEGNLRTQKSRLIAKARKTPEGDTITVEPECQCTRRLGLRKPFFGFSPHMYPWICALMLAFLVVANVGRDSNFDPPPRASNADWDSNMERPIRSSNIERSSLNKQAMNP